MDSYRRLRPLTIVLIVSFFISCKQKQPRVDRSYYYWRGSGYITGPERDFVKQHQIHKIYARLMDVDWSEVQGTIPVSQVNLPELDDQLNGYDTFRVAIVPVVFLTNKTFEKIADTEIQL